MMLMSRHYCFVVARSLVSAAVPHEIHIMETGIYQLCSTWHYGEVSSLKRLSLVIVFVVIGIATITRASADQQYVSQGSYCIIENDGYIGLVDSQGNTVIPTEYTGIYPIKGGFCVVETEDNRVGLYSISGDEILPTEYEYIDNYGTRCIVWTFDDNCFLYDPISLKMVTPAYPSIFANSRWCDTPGYFIVLDDDGDFLISADGDVLTEKAAHIKNYYGTDEIYLLICDDGCRYYSPKKSLDAMINNSCYVLAGPFIDGYAWVSEGENLSTATTYIIDSDGRKVSQSLGFIIDENFSYKGYGYGSYPYSKDGKWYIGTVTFGNGFIDILGPEQEKPMYLGKGYYSINRNDGLSIFCSFTMEEVSIKGATSISSFENDSAVIWNDKRVIGFLFSNGDYVKLEPFLLQQNIIAATPFIGEYAFVCFNDLWYPINRSGYQTNANYLPNVHISEDGSYFLSKKEDGYCIVLNQELEPITRINE